MESPSGYPRKGEENRKFSVRWLGVGATVGLLAVMPGVVPGAHAGTSRSLNLVPEQRARPTGTTASAEATLSRRPSKGSSILINFEVAGVNHPDGGDTPGTPP